MRRRLTLRRGLATPPERLLELLREPARIPGRVPAVLSARVLDREGDVEVVELAFASLPDPLLLEVVHIGPGAITYHQVDRFAARAVSGALEVSPAPEGSRVTVSLRVPGFLPGRRRRLRNLLATSLEAAAAAPPPPTPSEELDIRLAADGDGLVITIAGRRFRLLPEGPP